MGHDDRRFQEKEARLAFWMLAPAFLTVLILVLFPAIWNIWLSLKPVTLGGLRDPELFRFDPTIENFIKVSTAEDFGAVFVTTLVYTISGSALSVLIGLFAALMVQGTFPGRGFVRGLLISPYIAPVVAVTFVWGFILDPQLGILNWLGFQFGWFDRPIPFLSQRWLGVHLMGFDFSIPLALTTVILFEGWRYFPFAFLFILARLQAVPEDLYRAAAVDGASPLQRFRHVTLPQLVPVLSALFLFRFIWTINKFDDIFLLTRGQSGTEVLPIRVYKYAFGEFDIGASSATAMILFGILVLFLFLMFRLRLRQ
jgi:multiple sugar transport system permease protein